MHYTAHRSQDIDSYIHNHLSIIVEAIRRELPCVSAVVLVGGFGRGEGSVLVENGRILPVNDYDLVLATSLPCDQSHLINLATRLAQQIGIRHIDLIPIPITDFGSLPPSQFNYDMKYGGRVLWGEDVLSMMPPIAPATIPLSDGGRLLINRAVCLLEGFPDSRSMGDVTSRFFSFNQTAKVVLACGEALLVQAGRYTHSYARRNVVVHELFADRTEFCSLHETAVRFKLWPIREPEGALLSFWNGALGEYVRTLYEIVLGLQNWYPDRRSAVHCLERLKEWMPVDSIELSELALIFARYLGGWAGQWWTFLANRYLEAPLHQRTWNRLRRRAIKAWHMAHP